MSSGKDALINAMRTPGTSGPGLLPALGSMDSNVDRRDPPMGVPGALGMFDVSTNDEYNHNGAMTLLSSNAKITQPYGYNRVSTPKHWHSQGQLIFLSSAENSSIKYDRVYQACGLSMLNYRLANDVVFASRYDYHSSQRLTQNWRWIGAQTAENIFDGDTATAEWQTLVVDGRARMPNIWCALESRRKNNSAVQEGDQLYLLIKRFKRKQLINRKRTASAMQAQRQNATNPQPWKATADEYYWQYVPYVSTDGSRPPAILYSELDLLDRNGDCAKEGYYGDCVFIGTIHEIYNDARMTQTNVRDMARNCVYPKYDNNAYMSDFALLPSVAIMLRK